jgi:hypothetical protein
VKRISIGCFILILLALLSILASTVAACPPLVTGSYVAPTYVAPVVVKKHVVAEVITPVVAPIAVFVPTYSATFIQPPVPVAPPAAVAAPAAAVSPSPPPPPAAPAAAPSTCEKNNQAMLEIVKDLRREIDDLKRQKAGVAPADPNEPQPLPAEPEPTKPNPGADTPGTPAPAPPPAPPEKTSALPATSPALALATAKCARCHQRGRESEGANFVLLEGDGSFARLDARGLAALSRRLANRTMPPRSSGIPALTDAEAATLAAWLKQPI